MSNLIVYGVVNNDLLQAHMVVTFIAQALDMNDFLYVGSAYLLQRSTAFEFSSVQPVVATLSPCELCNVCDRPMAEMPMLPPLHCLSMASPTLAPSSAVDIDVVEHLVNGSTHELGV